VRASAALSSPDSLWISACPLVVLAETQVVQSSSCCLSWRIWSFAEATLAREAALGPGRLVLPIALEIEPSGIHLASSADDRRPTDPVAVFVYEAVPRAARRSTTGRARSHRLLQCRHSSGRWMTMPGRLRSSGRHLMSIQGKFQHSDFRCSVSCGRLAACCQAFIRTSSLRRLVMR
jgi:hypothetical protein